MKEKLWTAVGLSVLVGCMAVEEDFRVQHEGVLTGNVTVSEDEPGVTAPSPSHQWTVESLAVRAGKLSQAMREGEIEALIARIKADADTAWRDPEFRYSGAWGDGTSHSDEKYGESTSHYNQFGARVYIPNPFVNRYLSRKGDANVRRCEAKGEAKAYAVYVETKLMGAEYLRLKRELGFLERKAELLAKARDLATDATTNNVARSPFELIRSETKLRRNAVKLEFLKSSLKTLRGNLAALAQLDAETLELVDAPAENPDGFTLEQLCELAYRRRPDLALAFAEYDLAMAESGAAKAAYIPWFRFVEAAYRAERGSQVKRAYDGGSDGDRDKDHDFRVEVAITVPLFTWCGNSVSKANRLAELADERIRALEESIRGEIAAAYENYRSTVSALGENDAAFEAAMAKRIDEASEAGLNAADEADARIELLDHEIMMNSSRAIADEARIRLESVIGGPLVK